MKQIIQRMESMRWDDEKTVIWKDSRAQLTLNRTTDSSKSEKKSNGKIEIKQKTSWKQQQSLHFEIERSQNAATTAIQQ